MIECQVCGGKFARISVSHLKYKHDMTMEEYRQRWPDAPLLSPKERRRSATRSRKLMRARWKDPEMRVKIIKGLRRSWENADERRQAASLIMKALNKDPSFHDEEARLEAMERLWADPTFREKRRQSVLKQWEDPEFRQMQIERMKRVSRELWADPAHRARMGKHMFKWTKPEKIVRSWLKEMGAYHTAGGCFVPHVWREGVNVDFSDGNLLIALHVDGDFWHDPEHFPERAKKDQENDRTLRRAGWAVLRLRESDIYEDPKSCRQKIRKTIHRQNQ